MLVDGAGGEAASAVRSTPFEARPTGVEADVEDLLAVVAAVVAGLGDARARVAAVGVAGLAESGAPLDGAERPLAPVIAWHDPRGGEAVAVLEERFGDDLALAVGQRLRTVSSVAKLGWLAANGVTGVRWWLGVPELCLHRLTGVRATDFSLVARTGAYDVVRRASLPEVAVALDLPADVFAQPSPAGAVLGSVTPDGAAWSGLPVGIPVTVAGHDHLAGAVGSGMSEDDDLANSVGTAETVVGRSATAPDVGGALDRRVAVSLWPDGAAWAVLASAARAGLVLDAAASALGRAVDDLDRLAEGEGRIDAAGWVDAMVESARRPSSAGGPAADAGGVARPDGPPGAVWNGVLDALVARTWDAVERVEQVAGPAGRLVVFGGGSRSRPWLRAKADGGRLPVVRSTAGEAVARGAAVSAGVAAGWGPSAAGAPRPRLDRV